MRRIVIAGVLLWGIAIVFFGKAVAEVPIDSVRLADFSEELKQMMAVDQKYRMMMDSLEETYGWDSEEMQSAWINQNLIDSLNMARLEEIIAQIGWPGISMVGAEANMAAFLILQHADFGYQKKYLPLLRDGAKNGEVKAADLALLEDRVLMRDGKKQVYGSQLRRNSETGQVELWPIEDEVNVDKRREAVGLEPMKDYMARFGLEYEPSGESDSAK